jgi:tetratricopeptide (TPR) repeat protein
MRKTISILVLLLLPSSFLLGQMDKTALVDGGVARAYFRGALDLHERGDRDGARELLFIASEFDPTDSDILYLRGLVESTDQSRTREAIESLSEAVRQDNWRRYGSVEGRALLARLLYRTRRYGEALSVLAEVSQSPPPAEILILRVRALASLGRVAEASQAARTGADLYAADLRFRIQMMRMDDLPGYRWGKWLRRHASSSPHILEAILYYALRQPTDSETREMLDLYFHHGGQDPLAVLVDWAANGERDLTVFRDLGGFEDLFLIRRAYALAGALGGREQLSTFIQEFDGWIEGDSDRDGFYETRILLSQGTLRRWEQDADQDGLPERVLLSDGLAPLAVFELEPTRSDPEGGRVSEVRIGYDEYPAVGSVTFITPDRRREFYLIPGKIEYSIVDRSLDLESNVPHMLVPIDTVPAILNLESVRKYTYQVIERTREDSPPSLVASYVDGVLHSSKHDRDRDGSIDHVIDYVGGLPATGRRDLDADGRFEVRERYTDGRLSLLLVDNDSDGTPEFQTRLESPERMSWDFDEDGLIDMQEPLSGHGRLLDELSDAGGKQ